MDELPNWPRPYHSPGGGNARVSVIVYGEFGALDADAFTGYRTAGLPHGVGLIHGPGAPVPTRHIWIVVSLEDDGSKMYRTMGMHEFGRPTLYVRYAGSRYESAIVSLLEEYTEFQAFGGTIRPGEKVTSPRLPAGGRARYISDPIEPESTERVVEFVWPEGALAQPWWRFW